MCLCLCYTCGKQSFFQYIERIRKQKQHCLQKKMWVFILAYTFINVGQIFADQCKYLHYLLQTLKWKSKIWKQLVNMPLKDCYGVEYFSSPFVMSSHGIFREITNIPTRIATNIKKLTNVWCLCGPLLSSLFIDKKSFISISLICRRLLKALYTSNCARLCLLPFNKPWISITVVEMHWDACKEGCCKKSRILDIITY